MRKFPGRQFSEDYEERKRQEAEWEHERFTRISVHMDAANWHLGLAIDAAAEIWPHNDYPWDFVRGQINWGGRERPAGVGRRRIYTKAVISRKLQMEVWERDAFRCKECGGYQNLTVDHIIPESKGGTLELDNLQTLCRSCNSRKGAKV